MGRWAIILLVSAVLAACGPPVPSGQNSGESGAGSTSNSGAPAAPKILVAAISEDPKNFWDGINGGGGSGARELGHLVNQYLAVVNTDGTPEARLLAELPSVENGDWLVNPDGTMQVTYKLRPGVTWHDGTPFSADDVVFSWQVGRDPAIPNGNQSAVKLISSVQAADPLTAVTTWSATYPFADRLEHREFYPFPVHLLQSAYQTDKDNFVAQPYFTDAYVGTGPFKVGQWQHGSELDLVANNDFFLGRPKLDQLHVLFIADPNTVLANLRSGTLNAFLPPGGPSFQAYQPLGQEWSSTGHGTLLNEQIRWTLMEIQKADFAQPGDLRNANVRLALLLAMNRPELAQALLSDLGTVADSWVSPKLAYYPQVKNDITQYPFDPRQATSLLANAGWTRGPDGVLQKGGAPFQFDMTYTNADGAQATAIIQQDWKAVGIESTLTQLTPFQLRDAQARQSFTGGDDTNNPLGGLSAVRRFESVQGPTQANGYAGTNRGHFADPQWDAIGERLRVSLSDSERLDLEAQLLRDFSVQLPALPLYFEVQVLPVMGFTGLHPVTGVAHTGEIMHTGNVYEWDMTP